MIPLTMIPGLGRSEDPPISTGCQAWSPFFDRPKLRKELRWPVFHLEKTQLETNIAMENHHF